VATDREEPADRSNACDLNNGGALLRGETSSPTAAGACGNATADSAVAATNTTATINETARHPLRHNDIAIPGHDPAHQTTPAG